jgi:REP element-mobilizing transposase RayT
MPQSLSKIYVHLVFSTLRREPMLSEAIRPALFAYLAGILPNHGCPPVKIGGTADHVHVMFVLARTATLSKVVEELKKGSSKWLKTQGVPTFAWQSGYGVFSVSASQVDVVSSYIENQQEHHRKTTFQDEFRQFCRKYAVELDERYVWD